MFDDEELVVLLELIDVCDDPPQTRGLARRSGSASSLRQDVFQDQTGKEVKFCLVNAYQPSYRGTRKSMRARDAGPVETRDFETTPKS